MSAPRRILLVDDDLDYRTQVIRELTRAFPTVEINEIEDAKGFAEAVKTSDFDLVITEYRLKWSDGLKILRAIKDRHTECPIIMLTATGSEEIALEAMKAGLDDYIIKSPNHFTSLTVAARLAMEHPRKHRRAKGSSTAQQEILQMIFDHIPVMIAFIGEDGRLKLVNREWNRRLGWSPDEIERQDFEIFAECCPDPEDRQRIRDFIFSGEGKWADFKTRAIDGRVIDTSWATVRLSDGTSVGIGQDITARKRVEQDLQRNLQRIAIQAEITAAISSTLNLRDVLDLLSEKINLLLPYSATSIRLVDKKTGNLEPAACRNFDEEEWKALYSKQGGHGLSRITHQTKKPVVVDNVQTDPRTVHPDFFVKNGLVALLSMPLIARGEAIGVINYHTKYEHNFTREEVEFLGAISGQAAIAIQNAQLHDQIAQQALALERSNKELKIRTHQQAIVSHLGDLALRDTDVTSLFDEATALICQTLHVEFCSVLELLPHGKTFLLRAGVGWKAGHVEQATVEAETNSPAGFALVSASPVIFENLREETRFTRPASLLDREIDSGICVAIQGREMAFGVLGAYTARPRAFSADDIHFIQSITNVLAAAVEHERAQEAIRFQRQRENILHDINRTMTSTLDLKTVLDGLLEKIDLLLPYSAVTLRLLNKSTGELEPMACRNMDAEEWKNLKGNLRLARSVLDSRKPLSVLNIQKDRRMAFPDHLRKHGLISSLGVPLIARNETLGVFSLYTTQEHIFSSEEIDFVISVASQAAIAIYNSRLYEEVFDTRERLQALSRRLVEVQETERRRVARELHDEIGQALTGLKLSLEMVGRLPIEEAKTKLGEAQALVNEIMERVRGLSLELRPSMLDDLGLLPTLLWHFGRYTAQTNVEVEFKHRGLDGQRFSPEVEISAYRIIQEALTNVARHARVRRVTVGTRSDQRTLLIKIEDEGAGFDSKIALTAGKSSGLTGMRERASLLGGTLTLQSSLGGGTHLMAELPVDTNSRRNQKAVRR